MSSNECVLGMTVYFSMLKPFLKFLGPESSRPEVSGCEVLGGFEFLGSEFSRSLLLHCFDRRDSDKREELNISLLSSCCL